MISSAQTEKITSNARLMIWSIRLALCVIASTGRRITGRSKCRRAGHTIGSGSGRAAGSSHSTNGPISVRCGSTRRPAPIQTGPTNRAAGSSVTVESAHTPGATCAARGMIHPGPDHNRVRSRTSRAKSASLPRS